RHQPLGRRRARDRHDRAAPGDRSQVLTRRRLLGVSRQPRLRPHRLRRRRPLRRHLAVLAHALEDPPNRTALELTPGAKLDGTVNRRRLVRAAPRWATPYPPTLADLEHT